MESVMSLAQNPPDNNSDLLLLPKETLAYLASRYNINIKLKSFYSMINRKQSPKPTYFRNRPKFYVSDIDEWVRQNLSDHRKKGDE
jgi:predicted DNA-binding transcriptional regulator AlpA